MDVDGQAAVGDQLTTDGGICFRSPRRGNGSLEALQPNAPLGRGASSPCGRGSRSATKPYNLLLLCSPSQELGNPNNTRVELINMFQEHLSSGLFEFLPCFESTTQSILQRGVAELSSNDGGCSLFVLSLMAPSSMWCPPCDLAALNPSIPPSM